VLSVRFNGDAAKYEQNDVVFSVALSYFHRKEQNECVRRMYTSDEQTCTGQAVRVEVVLRHFYQHYYKSNPLWFLVYRGLMLLEF
jgi:hypothetical protein